jgi:hypothetical protein
VRARLVQIEHGRRVGATQISSDLLTIGRDPGCDVVLEHARISRLHARIEASENGHVLIDLNSTNGTVVAGQLVRGAVRLRPGDAIELAGEVTLVYRAISGFPVVPAAGVAVLFAAFAAVLVWTWNASDPVLDEAYRLAREAVEADRRGDYARAHRDLKSAFGLLYREGRLDDVPRRQVMQTAMQRLEEGIEEEVDLTRMFERTLEATRPTPPPPLRTACRLDEVLANELDRCLHERVILVMLGIRQEPDAVPEWFYMQVGRRLRLEHAFLSRALERVPRYREMMVEEFERANMPPMLRYLSLVESGLRPRARSAAGAVGLWQFMPGTARDYGLVVAGSTDERYDTAKSTRAAARYLNDLAMEFGGDALLLALASYNRGENAVRRALRKLGDPWSDRTYWALVEARYLPKETAQYVTRFVAAAVAGEAGLPSEEVLRAAGY